MKQEGVDGGDRVAGPPQSSGVARLGEIGRGSAALYGNKAAMLGTLFHGCPIPDGFCIPCAELEPADRLLAAYETLQARRGREPLPVAVRSSGPLEDGLTESGAGRHTTRLNVAGPGAVAEAAAECERSLGGQGALVVQEMVAADAAAVIASAAGAACDVLINASWGLGPSLADGLVTPDSFRFRRDGLVLRSEEIGRKTTMTIPSAGGVAEVAVPPPMQPVPAISADQAREGAALALSLEARLGYPVDLECAWADGAMFVLQCRPLTRPVV